MAAPKPCRRAPTDAAPALLPTRAATLCCAAGACLAAAAIPPGLSWTSVEDGVRWTGAGTPLAPPAAWFRAVMMLRAGLLEMAVMVTVANTPPSRARQAAMQYCQNRITTGFAET